MGKYERPKKKSGAKRVLIPVVLLLLVALLGLFVMPQVLYRFSGETETVTMEETEVIAADTEPAAAATVPAIQFPLELENGALTIESLFQYDGINPDCGNEEGKNIASITVKNTSDKYLAEAKISLELEDGARVSFVISHLPAGKSAMAFAVDNAAMDSSDTCVNADCTALWLEVAELLPEAVTVFLEGTTITLENNTDQEIPELIIYCRSPFDEEYFGGIAYEYTVNNLPANGTTTVEALDCILGLAEVVRIAMN